MASGSENGQAAGRRPWVSPRVTEHEDRVIATGDGTNTEGTANLQIAS